MTDPHNRKILKGNLACLQILKYGVIRRKCAYASTYIMKFHDRRIMLSTKCRLWVIMKKVFVKDIFSQGGT